MKSDKSQRTLHLHIGTEKTGTTTLQALGNVNRALLKRNGILYPVAPGRQNHIGLAVFASRGESVKRLQNHASLDNAGEVREYRDDMLARLRVEVKEAGCANIVMSNEHLSSRVRREAEVHRLIGAMGQIFDDIRVVVYLRPQYDLVSSAYSTLIKVGHETPIKLDQREASHYYNYDRMLTLWEDAVGRDRICVRRFMPDRFVGGSLVSDFFDALGLPMPADLEIPEARNTSLDTYTIEFLRIINELTPALREQGVQLDRGRLVGTLQRLSTGPKFTVDGAALAEMDKTFEESNKAVADRYFPGAKRLFPAFARPEQTASPALDVRHAVELALALWVRRGDAAEAKSGDEDDAEKPRRGAKPGRRRRRAAAAA